MFIIIYKVYWVAFEKKVTVNRVKVKRCNRYIYIYIYERDVYIAPWQSPVRYVYRIFCCHQNTQKFTLNINSYWLLTFRFQPDLKRKCLYKLWWTCCRMAAECVFSSFFFFFLSSQDCCKKVQTWWHQLFVWKNNSSLSKYYYTQHGIRVLLPSLFHHMIELGVEG